MNSILRMGKNDTEFLFLPRQLPLTDMRENKRTIQQMQSIKLCSLGQDQNNCLVLDVEQTSLPSKCSHLSQDTWSKLELLILLLLLLYWCHMLGLRQE